MTYDRYNDSLFLVIVIHLFMIGTERFYKRNSFNVDDYDQR